MSRNRTERLVNLVICLLSAKRFLTAAQIASLVPGYEHDPRLQHEHEAFQRKFERDKAELRELGVPLETGTTSVCDAEPGYRIARRDYALPEVCLESDEATMVGLAARLWQHAGLSAAATSGLAKLRAAGVEIDQSVTLGIEPIVTVDQAFEPVTQAVRARQAIRFAYRVPEADDPAVRRLQPWGVVSWRGRWYVVGFDLDRDAPRCFRLSRITGPISLVGKPGAYTLPDTDLLRYVAGTYGVNHRQSKAIVWIKTGQADGVRRWAEELIPHGNGDQAIVRYANLAWFASWIAGYGSSVVVLDPPDARRAVIERLRRIRDAHRCLDSGIPVGASA